MARPKPLDRHALSVGRLCHAWAELELAISTLFQAVSLTAFYPHVALMTDCLDFRDQVGAIKVGAVAAKRFNNAWVEEVIDAMNYIDNDLRPLRNRYVHDLWWEHDGNVRRATLAPKTLRPQARMPLSFSGGSLTTESPASIRSLIRDVRSFTDWVARLSAWAAVTDPAATLAAPPRGLLAKRPQRRLLPPQPEMQSPSGSGATKPPPPPKS